MSAMSVNGYRKPRRLGDKMTQRIFQHWKTSVGGSIGAVLLWWYAQGFKIPETKQEWAATIGGVLIVLLGLGAKDPGHTGAGGDDAK